MENDYVKMGGIEMIPEAIEIESIADALPIVRKEIAATRRRRLWSVQHRPAHRLPLDRPAHH